MKSSSSRRNPRNAAIRTPDGLDQVYGVHALESLLERGEAPRELWVQQGAGNRLKDVVANAQVSGARTPLTPEGEESLWLRLRAWHAPTPPLLLVLDGVTDVHNFGACLRSADAAGAHGVIVAKDKAAPLNATVRKVACGAAEVVPVYQVTNLSRTLAKLKDAGVWITGTAGEAEASVFEIDMTGPTALVMGAEGKGMRRLTREACDNLAKLPMAGQVSSLNVSVATGICLFEAVRQRQLAS